MKSYQWYYDAARTASATVGTFVTRTADGRLLRSRRPDFRSYSDTEPPEDEMNDTHRRAESKPYIVGLGGTTREGSSTERALRICLACAEEAGAQTTLLGAADLDLPMYAPERPERSPAAQRLVRELARADGVIVGSPGYHGGMSGLLKNALDYVEDLRSDRRPYLDGRGIGIITCAYGWQAAMTALVALRSVAHALRGWPTPLGVAINSAESVFEGDGIVHEPTREQLRLMSRQVVEFAEIRSAAS